MLGTAQGNPVIFLQTWMVTNHQTEKKIRSLGWVSGTQRVGASGVPALGAAMGMDPGGGRRVSCREVLETPWQRAD